MHCFDNAQQIAFDERDAGAFDRDIGSCSHCDPDIGSRKGRRIVNSVARHRDNRAIGFQLFDDIDFLIRHYFSAEFIDAQFACNRLSRAPIVPGAHDDFQTHPVKRANGVSGRWFDGISDTEDTQRVSIDCYPDGCLRVFLQPICLSPEFVRNVDT